VGHREVLKLAAGDIVTGLVDVHDDEAGVCDACLLAKRKYSKQQDMEHPTFINPEQYDETHLCSNESVSQRVC
jgi:hypothetical protein